MAFPLLLFFHWTNMRGSAAIAAAFILVNSVAGLAGHATVMQSWPAGIPLLVAVTVGCWEPSSARVAFRR